MEQFNLEEYLKNPSKKVVTRDGRKARIICTDAKNDYPIVALIEMPNGRERQPCGYKEDGTYIIGERLSCDLFFAPEKHEGWLNIYRSERGFYLRGNPYKSKEEAEKVARANYKTFCATVKIEWEE